MENVEEKLKKYGQEELINRLAELDVNEKNDLLKEINEIDFEQLSKLYARAISNDKIEQFSIEPMSYLVYDELDEGTKKKCTEIGEEILKNNGYAFVIMAGGQGTRLGHNGPKGTYILDDNKSLFEIFADRLQSYNKKYGVSIPWYIMTSRENNDDTIKFFEDKNYLGYAKEDIIFFKQGELPMILENGNLVMKTKSKIKFAADGHGGVFEALSYNGITADMKKRGIKWVFIGGVDNCLLQMVDPLLVGLCEESEKKLASKTLVKNSPEEKVGVFCKNDGKPYVIEYSEISSELANMRDSNGGLVYGESHILCNLFSIDILNKLADEKLPYHVAHKKTDFVNKEGKLVNVNKPNAYKFESFIFDAFGLVDDMLLLRVSREDNFAPLKNKEGVDSPETARALYRAYRAKLNNEVK